MSDSLKLQLTCSHIDSGRDDITFNTYRWRKYKSWRQLDVQGSGIAIPGVHTGLSLGVCASARVKKKHVENNGTAALDQVASIPTHLQAQLFMCYTIFWDIACTHIVHEE